MTKPADDRTAEAREWLNDKHFTSDSGATLDCLALLPDEHVLALNIGQLAQILAAYGSSAIKEAREECARAVCQGCKTGWPLTDTNWFHRSPEGGLMNCIAFPILELIRGER
jgi:hypothetical protein